MTQRKKPPFHSLSFWVIRGRRPRTSLRLAVAADGDAAAEEGLFDLVVQTGSATNPTAKTTRSVSRAMAERLRDALQEAGVFGWDETYGDATAPGSLRWALAVVFEPGVFTLQSKGGSDVPLGFDAFLEEMYRLDLPRPAVEAPQSRQGVGRAIGDMMGVANVGSVGGMSAGDLGAYAATKGADNDFSFLQRLFKSPGAGGQGAGFEALEGVEGISLDDIDRGEVAKLFSQMQHNPQAMTQRLREEFRHLPPHGQNQLLDALAATGYATRAWWERFFRGI